MRIKELRDAYDIQQKELASVLGISPNTLSQYENSRREPSPEIISKIAKYFHVSTDFIYGLTDFVRCNDCGLEFCPLIRLDMDMHKELHERWEVATKKFGTIYALHAENERIKAKNRTIVHDLDNYTLEERYEAQLEVFRCLFSRSLSALNFNEKHIDYVTYVSMLLNQQHIKSLLDLPLYNKLVEEFGTSEGIPYGTYYEPAQTQPITIAAHLDTDDLTEAELDDVAKYIEFIKAKKK